MTKQRREQEEEIRRRLRWGVFLSLAVHFLLVFGGGWVLSPARDDVGVVSAEMPLKARLMHSASAVSAPPALSPRVPEPQKHRSPVLSAEPLAHAVNAVPPAPTFAAPVVSNTQASPAETPPAVSADVPGVAAAPASAAPASNGLDANALRGYRLALAIQARRFKRYPAQAQAQAWAGTAEVRLALAAGGRPEVATLTRSSGYDVLDRAALEMMNAAVQRTPVPVMLQTQAFSVTLPVVFNLDE
jgi:protein TonB